MITIFREQKDAYTKNAIFRLYRDEEKKQSLQRQRDIPDRKVISPMEFSNICLFPNSDLRG